MLLFLLFAIAIESTDDWYFLTEIEPGIMSSVNPTRIPFEYPNYVEHKVYHYSPTEQETCLGFYSLKPYETKTIDMELNPAAAVVRSNIILITSPTLKKVNIFPTRVGIEFDYKKDCF